jgi:hypothetical protein
MNLHIVRISTLVVCAVLSYACSGGGASARGLDAAGAAGAADVSSEDPQGGADNDGGQGPERILSGDATWFDHPATKIDVDGLGGDGACDAGKPRVAEPLPLPVPAPSPEMAR